MRLRLKLDLNLTLNLQRSRVHFVASTFSMNLRRICDVITRRNVRLQNTVLGRFLASESMEPKNEVVDITVADEKPVYLDDPQFQEELAKKRNKSRLSTEHRNILMGERPYAQPMAHYHNKVRYKKRMLGRYGFKGNDEPVGFAWPTLKEVRDAQEYERVAFPLSIQERWKKLEEAKRIKAEQVQAREAEIAAKLEHMKQWTIELNAKIAIKEAELEAARLRKKRLVEEVRKHFGFRISFNDERFKTMLKQKEREENKKMKEAKKKAKLEKFKSIIQERSTDTSQEQATESTKVVEE